MDFKHIEKKGKMNFYEVGDRILGIAITRNSEHSDVFYHQTFPEERKGYTIAPIDVRLPELFSELVTLIENPKPQRRKSA